MREDSRLSTRDMGTHPPSLAKLHEMRNRQQKRQVVLIGTGAQTALVNAQREIGKFTARQSGVNSTFPKQRANVELSQRRPFAPSDHRRVRQSSKHTAIDWSGEQQ